MAKARTSKRKGSRGRRATGETRAQRRARNVAAHRAASKQCRVCKGPHSKRAHWSHRARSAKGESKFWFGQTPRPKGRRTPAGNMSRAVISSAGGAPKRRRKKAARASGKRYVTRSDGRRVLSTSRTLAANKRPFGTVAAAKKRAARKASGRKAKRTPAQRAATARLVALNKARRGGSSRTKARKTSSRRAASMSPADYRYAYMAPEVLAVENPAEYRRRFGKKSRKGGRKPARSAAQKAATRKMLAANKAKRGGTSTRRTKARKASSRRAPAVTRRVARTKPRRTAAQRAATARLVAMNKAKRGGRVTRAPKSGARTRRLPRSVSKSERRQISAAAETLVLRATRAGASGAKTRRRPRGNKKRRAAGEAAGFAAFERAAAGARTRRATPQTVMMPTLVYGGNGGPKTMVSPR